MRTITNSTILAIVLTFNLIALQAFHSFSNNLSITNVSADGADIRFNISWDNSWFANVPPYNWDGIWVFIKYSNCSSVADWTHADLSTNAADDSIGTPLEVQTVTDGKGVFIKRASAGGPGSIASTGVRLRLNIPAGTYNFRVFGVEMVYINSGDFRVGYSKQGGAPFNQIVINNGHQSGGLAAATLGTTNVANLPSTYPMGVYAFWCMKYEVSQEQYVGFLNTLTYDQQATRTAVAPNDNNAKYALVNNVDPQYRNGVRMKSAGDASTTPKTPAVYMCDLNKNLSPDADDGENIPCNYLSWGDQLAYMDWAALRPYTELEFTKACRGPNTYVPALNEMVWGSAYNTVTYAYSEAVSNSGKSNEVAGVSGNGLSATNNTSVLTTEGPIRCGFAATASTNRVTAGATYYGVLDMGGNLYEHVITTNTGGTGMTRAVGDGVLDATTGNHNEATWPASATGGTLKGGAWYAASVYAIIDCRVTGWNPWAAAENGRAYHIGARGVRDE